MENEIKEYQELDQRELAIVEERNKILASNEEIFKAVANLDAEANSIVAKREEVKEKIKLAMEANCINKFENDYLTLTYVAPYEKVTVDTTRLKEEMPDIYQAYSKVSEVKGSLRIKVKNAE